MNEAVVEAAPVENSTSEVIEEVAAQTAPEAVPVAEEVAQ